MKWFFFFLYFPIAVCQSSNGDEYALHVLTRSDRRWTRVRRSRFQRFNRYNYVGEQHRPVIRGRPSAYTFSRPPPSVTRKIAYRAWKHAAYAYRGTATHGRGSGRHSFTRYFVKSERSCAMATGRSVDGDVGGCVGRGRSARRQPWPGIY